MCVSVCVFVVVVVCECSYDVFWCCGGVPVFRFSTFVWCWRLWCCGDCVGAWFVCGIVGGACLLLCVVMIESVAVGMGCCCGAFSVMWLRRL